jgi:Saxitoxin biosynthesis operon protein SxtJ
VKSRRNQHPQFKERSFGISVGAVLLLIAAVLLWRGRVTAAEITGGIGALLLLFGLTKPILLKWPSAVWWKFAMVLGYVNARVILTIAFLLVLTPIGLLWRVIGRDPMRRRRRNFEGWSAYPARYRDPNHFTRMY